LARRVQSRDVCKWRRDVDSAEDLISLIVEAAATVGQQLGIFVCTSQSLLHRCRLCVEVGGSYLVRNTRCGIKETGFML